MPNTAILGGVGLSGSDIQSKVSRLGRSRGIPHKGSSLELHPVSRVGLSK